MFKDLFPVLVLETNSPSSSYSSLSLPLGICFKIKGSRVKLLVEVVVVNTFLETDTPKKNLHPQHTSHLLSIETFSNKTERKCYVMAST